MDTASLKLIVGLGNPGRQYAATRHNVGFHVVQLLAQRYAQGRPRVRFQAETVDGNVRGQRILLLCPQTFMNRSGLSVVQARDFYKLDSAEILIVCDDFNLPLGKLRCRPKGSSGGQKGLQDVIQRLGTDNIPRIRVGIGAPPAGWDVADYVLSKFAADEVPVIEQAVGRTANAVEDWIAEGMPACMNRYNADSGPDN